jgi:hypothetical protein
MKEIAGVPAEGGRSRIDAAKPWRDDCDLGTGFTHGVPASC